MKRLRFEYNTRLDFSDNIRGHSFTLRCTPFSDGRQTISEASCEVLPGTGKIWHSRDSFGNMLVCGRMEEPHAEFSFKVSGEAHILNSCEAVGEAAPFYSFHTTLTAPKEKIIAFYEEHKPAEKSLLSRAVSLSESLYAAMTYQKGVTGTDTTAEQAMEFESGVCQDYAHILLSLLRIEKIPCRYVSGLAFESGETHAWVEVLGKEGWKGFDPTHNRPADEDYICFAFGRDAADCGLNRGIFLGNALQQQSVYVKMEEY